MITAAAASTLAEVARTRRSAAVAQLGGFRPPDDPATSWFGKAVGSPEEGLPKHQNKPMFPLLQINIEELPIVPNALEGCKLLTLFMDCEDYPFGSPHGDGWLIREYSSLSGLVPLPGPAEAPPLRSFPIRWTKVDDDTPGWEDCCTLVDMTSVNEDEAASDAFFQDFNRYPQTKVGGYPYDIQHGVGVDGFVFQVGSEEKANWMWVDNGIAYFFKDNGIWRWSCQFY